MERSSATSTFELDHMSLAPSDSLAKFMRIMIERDESYTCSYLEKAMVLRSPIDVPESTVQTNHSQ